MAWEWACRSATKAGPATHLQAEGRGPGFDVAGEGRVAPHPIFVGLVGVVALVEDLVHPGAALAVVLPLESLGGHDPDPLAAVGEQGGDQVGHQRGAFGDEGQGAVVGEQVVEDELKFLAVDRFFGLQQLLGGAVPNLVPGHLDKGVEGGLALGVDQFLVGVEVLVAAVEGQAVALGQLAGDAAFARAGGAADPQDVGKPRSRMNRTERLLIYKKQTCSRCETPVESWLVGNRRIYACVVCQPQRDE